MNLRARRRAAAGVGAVLVLVAGGCSSSNTPVGPKVAAAESVESVESAGTSTTTSATPSTLASTLAPPVAEGFVGEFRVASVTDGDTIRLADGRRIRLAQVDAPEDTSRVDCYGPESTRALRAMIGSRAVTLRHTANGPTTDRYGRTVAEVYVGGVSTNEGLVRAGAARWYASFKAEDPDLASRLDAAQAEAKAAGRGLWSACGAPSSASATTIALATGTASATQRGSNCHPAYPDECVPPPPPDLDCPDIGHPVRVDHTYGDPHRLDADGDGIGCESYR